VLLLKKYDIFSVRADLNGMSENKVTVVLAIIRLGESASPHTTVSCSMTSPAVELSGSSHRVFVGENATILLPVWPNIIMARMLTKKGNLYFFHMYAT